MEGEIFFTGIGIGLVLVFRFYKNETSVWYGNGIGSLVHFIGNFSVHWHKLVPLVFHIGIDHLNGEKSHLNGKQITFER